MSYILDALNKAERQRNDDKVPSLHSTLSTRRSVERGKWVRTGLILFSIVILFALIFWFRQPLMTAGSSALDRSKTTLVSVKQKVSGWMPDFKQLTSSQPSVQRGSGSAAQQQTTPPAAPAKPKVARAAQPDTQTAKPANVKISAQVNQKLSQIRFNVISYSTQPAKRFVMTGSSILREGDRISADAIITHIKRDSVLVEIEGKEYRLRP